MATLYCPICASELADKVTIPETQYAEDGEQIEGTREIAPQGGILVCTGCHAAVSPDDATNVGRSTGAGPTQADIEFYPEPRPTLPEPEAPADAPPTQTAPQQPLGDPDESGATPGAADDSAT